MVVGLGTGSTAAFAVDRLGALLKSGELKDIVAVPTSVRTYEQALALGIPLATLDEQPRLDVAIDGADEVRGWWLGVWRVGVFVVAGLFVLGVVVNLSLIKTSARVPHSKP